MAASRSTVSFTEENWQELTKVPNKSKVVNIALKFYFDSKKLLKQKEEQFILDELHHYDETDESYSFEETFK